MLDFLRDLFGSKKFVAALAGVVFVAVNKLGLGIDENTVLAIIGLIASYVIGQGIADNGKEAVIMEAALDATATYEVENADEDIISG